MNIKYSDTKEFKSSDLKELFLSVDWESGQFPDKLVIAMKNSSTVYSAWDGDKLVGLMSVIDDSIMIVYSHYLLVNPEYQGYGIGKELVVMMKDRYKDFSNLVLIAYGKVIDFYKLLGYEEGTDGETPLFINNMI